MKGGNWGVYFGLAPDTEYTPLPPWDINEDGKVNILDLVIISKHLGESQPANPRVDVDSNGIVNILDMVIVANAMQN